MSNVLIRDVPSDDLDQIRSAAAEKGIPMQSYLCNAVHAQAAYVRRQAGLTRTAERLGGRTEVPPDERKLVLDAIEDAHAKRADQLSGPPAP